MLKNNLQQELKQAMLSRDQLKTSVLRMLLSAIGYFEIQKGGAGYEASDEDVLQVIQKEAKQRKDSIEQFITGQRNDLADKEKKELQILQTYLPKQMEEAEIRVLVKKAIAQTNAKTQQDIGKIMGVLMPQLKGKADGTIVNKLVREEMQSI